LFGAIGIFSQLESAFERLWQDTTPHQHGAWAAIRNALWNRLKAFLTLAALGLLLLISLVSDLVLTALRNWAQDLDGGILAWRITQWLFTVSLNAVVLTLIYKLMPRAAVAWRHASCGGLLAALAWQVGSQILGRFIIGGNYSAYGVVGSFIAVMLWVYCASVLLFLGGQLVQVLGHPDDPGQPPKSS
jgi:membrane protein